VGTDRTALIGRLLASATGGFALRENQPLEKYIRKVLVIPILVRQGQ
jgi:hypothetical protein